MALTTGSAWDTRAEAVAGSVPRWLVGIAYTGGTDRISNIYYDAGGGLIYQPYLLGLSELRYESSIDAVYPTITEVEVYVRRSSTIDTHYDDDTVVGNNLQIWLGFGGTSINVQLANLTIDGLDFPSNGVVVLRCSTPEQLLTTVPTGVVDAGSYTNIDPSNQEDGESAPVVLGRVDNTGYAVSVNGTYRSEKWQLCQNPFACATRIIGRDTNSENEYVFLINTGAGQTTAIESAYEYTSELDAYAILETHEATPRRIWFYGTHDTHRMIEIYAEDKDFATPTSLDVGARRSYYEVPLNPYEAGTTNNNNPVSWSFDAERGILGSIDDVSRRLCLQLSGDHTAPGNSTLTGVTLTYSLSSIVGTLNVYEGTRSSDGRGSTIGTDTTSGTKTVNLVTGWNKSDRFYLFEISSGASDQVNIYDVVVRFSFSRPMTVFEKFFVPGQYTKPFDERGRLKMTMAVGRWDTRPVNMLGEASRIFVPHRGANATIQPNSTSYSYDSLPYVVYYMLNTVLGISTTNIDGTSFDSVYSYLVTDTGARFKDHNIGRQIFGTGSALDILVDLCNLYGVLFYFSADQKWKMVMRNVSASPVETFGDAVNDFPTFDFQWGWTSEHLNNFKFNYHWNAGKQEFSHSMLLNPDATVNSFLSGAKTICTDAETNYGSMSELREVDCFWIWDDYNVMNPMKIWAQWYGVLRRWVTFRTKLSACKLEIGDIIRTNDQSQTWATGDVDFQVFSVSTRQEDHSALIRAYEINPLT